MGRPEVREGGGGPTRGEGGRERVGRPEVREGGRGWAK